jgi:REP element-mobilizing transposase RayT
VDEDAYSGPRRKELRLSGFNYATPGAYFVTIVLQDRACRLATLESGHSILRPAGHLVNAEWSGLPGRFPGLALDEYIVMPDHLHGLLILTSPFGGCLPNLSGIIKAFKSKTTVEYGLRVRHNGWPKYEKRLWQRGFFDEIIRDARHMDNVRQYIRENPMRSP